MSDLPNRIKSIRLKAGLTQEEFGKLFGLVKSTVSLYESGKSTPNDDIKIQICKHFGVSIDYLLGIDGIICADDVYGFNGGDTDAIYFNQKLSHQMSINCVSHKELADYLGVDETTIFKWASGSYPEDTSYSNYYKQLSSFFEINERYWTSPGAISPGIEPNLDEYNLILLYREYQKTGKFDSIYGNLEKYFQDLVIASNPDEEAIIRDFRNMNQDSKDIIKGKIKEVLREQRYEESLKNETLPAASGK